MIARIKAKSMTPANSPTFETVSSTGTAVRRRLAKYESLSTSDVVVVRNRGSCVGMGLAPGSFNFKDFKAFPKWQPSLSILLTTAIQGSGSCAAVLFASVHEIAISPGPTYPDVDDAPPSAPSFAGTVSAIWCQLVHVRLDEILPLEEVCVGMFSVVLNGENVIGIV